MRGSSAKGFGQGFVVTVGAVVLASVVHARKVNRETTHELEKITARWEGARGVWEAQDEAMPRHRHACPPAPRVARHVHVSAFKVARWLVAAVFGVWLSLSVVSPELPLWLNILGGGMIGAGSVLCTWTAFAFAELCWAARLRR